jgi:chromosome segregation protein
MENVIFNGTSNKKPMGMAEVAITLVNDKGILPTEYSEVTITRRIFRSGESEYLLNKNICRLKDITNLFMDTGMGTNAYSVIELKMVETILSSKADERRHMFEEAAGVNKYKVRRRLTLKKLEDVGRDLTRVNDIVSEVEKKVSSLERQAKRFDKYNALSTELKEKELNLAERELYKYNKAKENIKQEKEESLQKKIIIDSEIRKLDDELTGYRDQISAIETQLKDKRVEITAQTEKIHAVQQRITIATERKKALEKNIDDYGQELEELKYQMEENDELIEESGSKKAALTERIKTIEIKIQENEGLLEEKKNSLEEKRASLKTQSDEALIRFKDISGKENQLSNLKKSYERANANAEKLNEKIFTVTNNMAKTVGYLEDLDQEKRDIQAKLNESEAFYAEKQKEKEDLEKRLNALREKELEERGSLTALKDKIDFLQTLINNLDGVSKGAKVLLESDGWTDKEKTILADIGASQEDYRFAMEAALKNALNFLLIENTDDLTKAIEYLSRNELGKASFYVLGLDEQRKKSILDMAQDFRIKRKIKEIEKDKSFVGWAENYIETAPKWRPFFKKILARTAVVTDLESSLKLCKNHPDFSFAALNGDYVSESGVIDAGSAPKMDDTLLGRKQLLERLKDDYPVYQQRVEAVKAKIAETEALIDSIDLKDISDQGKLLMNDISNIEKQIAKFEFEKQKSSDEIEKARQDIQELAGETNRLEKAIADLSEELTKQNEERRIAEEALSKMEEEVKSAENGFNLFISERNGVKLEYERALGEKNNLEAAMERAASSKITIAKSIEKREGDITRAAEETTSLVNVIEDNQYEYDEFEADRKKLIVQETEIEGNLDSIRLLATEIDKKLQYFRKDRDEVSDFIHTVDIKINELNLKTDNLIKGIKESYSVTLEMKEFEDLESFNFDEESEAVQGLKQQIKNLGPINSLAFTEFEEEKQRLEFLHKQREDLIESEKDLLKTIEEINTAAQSLFLDTFEKVRENFITIFRSLFNPGDEADLRLEENADPLEAKIEIIAKPKGKRPTSIELLSGGEKTLTAIALLFSIYLVKPSPFCILDEVDAPLDDANVDRFTKIIHQFSKDTQFIIVTHNKRTMESAENLYGVTMQEEGVSKLVSVRFNEDLHAAS